ncbi:MAG TPA: hypothetical protein VGP68_02510, partial [Gemmataceae bacterium]|nr:hypothetical protein [Gemmataceae bacterium]
KNRTRTGLSRLSNRYLLAPPIPAGKQFRRGRDAAAILGPQPPAPNGRGQDLTRFLVKAPQS